MARSDEPNSATTHFFILVSDAPTLDGKFAAFGRVTKGMDVVDAINRAPVQNEKPDKPVRIRKATVGTCAVTPQ
jgi:peptidyl-prolyl cis-trans isomerase B (cyclophilin B)